MQFSPQQDAALQAVAAWYHDPSSPKVFRLSGFAGTGKTTLAKHFAESARGIVMFAAYTGKAASVLRQMGCPGASTLHSLLYSVSEHDRSRLHEVEDELAKLNAEPPELQDGFLIELLMEERATLMKRLNQPRFTLNPNGAASVANLIIVDESSMINEGMGKDLESFEAKLLVMGDPAQLPPIRGAGYFDGKPDILLTEIHRQARDNPILRFATMAREGGRIPVCDLGAAKRIDKKKFKAVEVANEEGHQMLVGKNDNRRKLNREMRELNERTGLYPNKGERLVVLRNDRDFGVLNGVTCRADSDFEEVQDEESLLGDLEYEENLLPGLAIDPLPFTLYDAPKHAVKDIEWNISDPSRRWMIPVDYAYALTVHKAQGSQWDKVMLVDDGFGHWGVDPNLRAQWLYTAITRAKHELIIVGGTG